MTDTFTRVLTLTTLIGAGLSAGVYFAFSTLVTAGIRRLSPAQAIAAMNGINKAAPASPVFMVVLFGTGLACLVLIVLGAVHRHGPGAGWLLAGAALVLVSLLITVVYHVPHNNRLIAADVTAATAAQTWSHYITPWLAWNHARTLTALAGTVSLLLALRSR
jgi:uncharacterized membrane protein